MMRYLISGFLSQLCECDFVDHSLLHTRLHKHFYLHDFSHVNSFNLAKIHVLKAGYVKYYSKCPKEFCGAKTEIKFYNSRAKFKNTECMQKGVKG